MNPENSLWIYRGLLVAASLAAWFLTQSFIARRRAPRGKISDAIHGWTAGMNLYLRMHPALANRLLVATSFLIDAAGIWLLASSIFGKTIAPFLGLFILFLMRQACQLLVALPEPPGMIWRHPGFPSALVTYGTNNDLFFSGHTAIAAFAGLVAGTSFGWPGILAGTAVVTIEAVTVLVLRAHYTMDVFTALVAALAAFGLAGLAAPHCDAMLAVLAGAR